MSGFSADWLRLREPFDLAARSRTLADGFKAALGPRRAQPWRIVDLACGSGANFRALAPWLEGDQAWLMVDHDPRLLAAQRTEIAQWAGRRGWSCEQAHEDRLEIHTGTARWQVRGRPLDLARSLEDIDLATCDGLVTTAFLDLVSAAWLDRLAALLAKAPRPLLATLSVDGRRTWGPAHPFDPLVAAAFIAHQDGDKGFGPSLGVRAVPHLAERLTAAGCRVETEASDWQIGPSHLELLLTLAREAAAVAAQTRPAEAPAVSAWLADRAAGIRDGTVSLSVGHLDLLAVPGTA